MPSWNQLVNKLGSTPQDQRVSVIRRESLRCLEHIGLLRGHRHVIFYCSGFLQKPEAPAHRIQITREDLNAFMSVMHGMTWSKNLTLLLHTPGGITNAAETIVAYLRSKFADIEVIVPTYAMSAGTMITLAANRIVMGRQSQLGPIDPQFPMGQRAQSARAIVDQFEAARKEILGNAAATGVWLPILQTIGPALLQEARNALDYGERMVSGWLEAYMFAETKCAKSAAEAAAAHFNDAAKHKSHGRRIDRDEARAQDLIVEDLEASQDLQEAVLTLYHLNTIAIEQSSAAKIIHSDLDKMYVKNWTPIVSVPQIQLGTQPPNPTLQPPAVLPVQN